jgi:hypothetical protein
MFRREIGAVAVATVTAVALGVAAGRWAWHLSANQAGLPSGPVTPLSVLWMIPATLLIAALVALPSARSVARFPQPPRSVPNKKIIIPNVPWLPRTRRLTPRGG